jgi:hypothetical protein
VYIAAGVSIAIIVVVASLGPYVQTALKQKCPRIFGRLMLSLVPTDCASQYRRAPMSLVGSKAERLGVSIFSLNCVLEQTSSGHSVASEKCQEPTSAAMPVRAP